MHSLGKLSLGSLLVCLGGCIVNWGYSDYDVAGTGAGGTSGLSASSGGGQTSGSGGMGTGGFAGAGGAGGATCSAIVCDGVSQECPPKPCTSLTWANRVGNGANQFANAVALDSNAEPNVALVGNYFDAPINFGNKDLALAEVGVGEGFVAHLASGNGTPNWTTSASIFGGISPRTAMAVDFDGINRVVVGGSVTLPNVGVSAYVGRLGAEAMAGEASLDKVYRFGDDVSTSIGKTEVVDLVVDGSNTYVLGSVTAEGDIKCSGAPVPVKIGFFVAKLDQMFACQWLVPVTGVDALPKAIATRDAFNNGIWVTGHFKTALEIVGPGDNIPGTAAGEDLFLLKFNDAGAFLGAQTRREEASKGGGSIKPLDLTVDGSGWPYVVGEVTGETMLDDDSISNGRPAAFVVGFDASANGAWKKVYPTGSGFMDAARLTSIKAVGSKLMLAGTFTESITIPEGSSNTTIPKAGSNAFVAKLDASTQAFDYFDYFPGFDESSNSQNIHLAANTNAFALGGGWVKTIDFSTADMMGQLTPKDSTSGQPDIIVALFGAP